jgi:hypothetical protein
MHEDWTAAVVTVGDGRGFVVDVVGVVGVHRERYVLTVAHCLPQLPSAHPGRYTEEQTFSNMLAPLGDDPTVWATCLFADPVADIAHTRATRQSSVR